jgi:hypothetical protein
MATEMGEGKVRNSHWDFYWGSMAQAYIPIKGTEKDGGEPAYVAVHLFLSDTQDPPVGLPRQTHENMWWEGALGRWG